MEPLAPLIHIQKTLAQCAVVKVAKIQSIFSLHYFPQKKRIIYFCNSNIHDKNSKIRRKNVHFSWNSIKRQFTFPYFKEVVGMKILSEFYWPLKRMRVSSHLKREQKSRLKPKGLEYKKLFNETAKVCQKAISIK